MKTMMITGCSRGIGNMACKRFYGKYKLIGLTTTQDNVNKLTKQFSGSKFYKCDIRNKEEVDNLFITNRFDRTDVLINNAGIKTSGKLEEITTEDYKSVMETNVDGAFYMMQNVIPFMKVQGYGKIINIASTVGYQGAQFLSPYAASKHALVGLSHSVRDELITQDSNITVHTLSPGATNTPFNDYNENQMDVDQVVDALEFIVNRDNNAIVDMLIYPAMEKRKP